MKPIILQKLKEIEAARGIKILYSCESGSRGWGFPSPDSDYDVRFIYIRPAATYLSVKTYKDNMNFPITGELDINGWDIRKLLSLACKSNTTPFEWLQSPVVYRREDNFREDAWNVCRQYFCPHSNIRHYLGISKMAMNSIYDGQIGIKKLFYILRPLLSALWCAEKRSIAPMHISPLLQGMPEDLREKVVSCIELKKTANEGFIIEVDSKLKTWIEDTFAYCNRVCGELDRLTFDTAAADVFFRETIERYDDR